jgi:hypothetical protein
MLVRACHKEDADAKALSLLRVSAEALSVPAAAQRREQGTEEEEYAEQCPGRRRGDVVDVRRVVGGVGGAGGAARS